MGGDHRAVLHDLDLAAQPRFMAGVVGAVYAERWSGRFAPAAREDRLVPIKVGPLTDEGILTPIVYADLTGCDEAEAQRQLLERVKKALDASYRPKPLSRPGFPGSPAREVPRKPQFPTAETNTEIAQSTPGTDGRSGTKSQHQRAGRRSGNEADMGETTGGGQSGGVNISGTV